MIQEFNTLFGKKNIDMVKHPDFDVLVPKTLYKFRVWNTGCHKRILTHNEAYFASPDKFNDPFDCNIEVAYYLLQTDGNIRYKFFKDLVDRNCPSYSLEQKEVEIQRQVNNGKYNDDEFIELLAKGELKDMIDQFGVFSMTAVNDNILLWSHYSDSHKGFCVGFDSVKLFQSIKPTGMGGNVTYDPEYPIISPNDEHRYTKVINTKAKFWDYEIEYRLTRLIQKQEDRLKILDADIITEVVFGYRISDVIKREIMDVASTTNPSVKFYIAVPKSRKFELEIVPL